MLCDVYPLRAHGQKLSADEVRAQVRRGWLELAQRDNGAPEYVATLRSERGRPTGELHCARVTKITRDGILITGWQSMEHVRQAWWCVPVPTS